MFNLFILNKIYTKDEDNYNIYISLYFIFIQIPSKYIKNNSTYIYMAAAVDTQPDDFVGIYKANKEFYSKLSEPLSLKPVTPLGSIGTTIWDLPQSKIFRTIIDEQFTGNHPPKSDMRELMKIIPFISLKDGKLELRKTSDNGITFVRHDDKIQLLINTMNDGAGDYGHISNYIHIFQKYGYKKENITVFIYTTSVVNEATRFKIFFDFIKSLHGMKIVKNTIDDETGENVSTVVCDGTESTEFDIITNYLSTPITPEHNIFIFINITNFLENYDVKVYDKYINSNDFLDRLNYFNLEEHSFDMEQYTEEEVNIFKNLRFNPDEINQYKASIKNVFDLLNYIKKKYKTREYSDKLFVYFSWITQLNGEFKDRFLRSPDVYTLDVPNVLYTYNTIKKISYYVGVNYYLSYEKKGTIPGLEYIPDEKNICGMSISRQGLPSAKLDPIIETSEKNIIITFSKQAPKDIFLKKCHNIIDTSEGGYNYGNLEANKGTKYNSGIGHPFLGIYQSASEHVRKDLTKKEVLRRLSEKYNENITRYHKAYVGQIRDIDVDIVVGSTVNEIKTLETVAGKANAQIIKFAIFIIFIGSLYTNTDIIHVLAPIIILTGRNKEIIKVFTKYIEEFYGTKIVIDTINNKIKIQTDKGVTIVIILYKPLKNKIEQLIGDELTFQEVLNFSEDPIVTTGDFSYQEALSLGKICIHDCINWKIPMYLTLKDTLERYYKKMNIVSIVPELLSHFYECYINIPRDLNIAKDPKNSMAYNTIRDNILKFGFNVQKFAEETANYKRFINEYVNIFYNADYNMGMLIYLHRFNIIKRLSYDETDVTDLMKSVEPFMIGGNKQLKKMRL